MIRRLIDQVVDAIAAPDAGERAGGDREAALRLATAVLMLDVARADHVFDDAELTRVLELVAAHFDLSAEAARDLVAAARGEAEDLVSVHEFTRVLHRHLTEDEKARIVGLLWEIAYADGELDKYEDALVRKIGDLLYVSRGRVMRLKHDAATAAG